MSSSSSSADSSAVAMASSAMSSAAAAVPSSMTPATSSIPIQMTATPEFSTPRSAAAFSRVVGSPGMMPTSSTLFPNFPPPPIFSVTDHTPLFQPMPQSFPWQPPSLQPQASLFPPPPIPPQIPLTGSVQEAAPSFFGSTFSGSPGVIRPVDQPGFGSPMSALAQSVSHITTVSQIVTIKLKAVEDYLTWRTQFESFLVSQGLFGIVDGSIQVPPMYNVDFQNRQVPNTEYYYWLRVDQTIRCWLFATLTRDVLVDVHDLKHSAAIWARLQTRFMSASLPRCMELKRLLSSLKKKETQSMESYLREIKNLVDALAAINSPVSDKELLQSILAGLGPDYKSLVTTVSLFPEQFPFHILEPRLLEAEQQLLSERQQQAAIGHQAFAVAAAGGQPPAGYAARGRGGRGRGRGRQGRGRGRGYPQQPYSFQHQAATSFGAQQPAGPQPSHGGSPAASGSGQQQGFGPQVFSQHPASIQGVQSTRPGTSGFSSGEGILGSVPPPVVCQLCFSAGHSALQCPSRYAPPSAPALLTSNNGDSNTALWYPDSGASAHMTPTEGQNFGEGPSGST
ncbi:unnamed protein product [Cuscuta epithymum]|uniref:Retrotransposon gag domain-containing protein n=1 Tax=Cuscuta epithymum TaxID=186058 RepID=A0AAV0CEQ5_9ASTE|nr:unnamed protein product [Cuscuta epithymum]